MTSLFCRLLLVFAGVAWMASITAMESEFPDWLDGKPDVTIYEHRCGIYEWLFDEADGQTEGMASTDELASKRLINIANKLVTHHLGEPEESYSAEVKFLVFREPGPYHFEFHINYAELERILNNGCRL